MVDILITDANIFIDLALTDRCSLLFIADWKILTTYEVFEELEPDQQAGFSIFIEQDRLVISDADSQVIDDVRQSVSNSVSDPDCTILALLKSTPNSILLSGDKQVVTACRSWGFEAHGIIWLIAQNGKYKHLTWLEMAAALEAIVSVNKRLPRDLCSNFIAQWKSNGNS